MNSFYYFPSAIHHAVLPQLLNTVEEVSSTYLQAAQNNYCVQQTEDIATNPAMSSLVSEFYNKGIEILSQHGYNTHIYDFSVIAWAQNISKYGHHDLHTHKESCLTGLYFIDFDEKGSFPILEDPRPGKHVLELESSNRGEIDYSTHDIIFNENSILKGSLLIFDSWLPHKLTKNMSDTPTKFIHLCLCHRRKFYT